jgi:hypothetical protein
MQLQFSAQFQVPEKRERLSKNDQDDTASSKIILTPGILSEESPARARTSPNLSDETPLK